MKKQKHTCMLPRGFPRKHVWFPQDKKSWKKDLNRIQYGVSPSHIPYKHIPSNRAPSTPDRGNKNSAKEWHDRNDPFKTKESGLKVGYGPTMVHLKKRGFLERSLKTGECPGTSVRIRASPALRSSFNWPTCGQARLIQADMQWPLGASWRNHQLNR